MPYAYTRQSFSQRFNWTIHSLDGVNQGGVECRGAGWAPKHPVTVACHRCLAATLGQLRTRGSWRQNYSLTLPINSEKVAFWAVLALHSVSFLGAWFNVASIVVGPTKRTVPRRAS